MLENLNHYIAVRSPIRFIDLYSEERTVLGSLLIGCSLYTIADLITPQSDKRGKTTAQKLLDFSVFNLCGLAIFKAASLDFLLYRTIDYQS